jgi:A/G-specific adenine glycosylase
VSTFPSEILIAWHLKSPRLLPWKVDPNPYKVWISEVMLQQTRVDTVIPYFERWMSHFPDIATLAEANQQEVLKLWEGLGYYGRARNLHRTAKILVEESEGRLPSDPQSLCNLPGIGRYTAGAIASFAFGLDEPVVDGNVKRVMARFFNLEEPVDRSAGERRIWELVEEHLPTGRASEYNQALMDLGAMVCTPRKPNCENCPLVAECQAYKLGVQQERPLTTGKQVLPHHTVTAAVIRKDGLVLLAQRPEAGLLGGMWEFPGGKQEPGEDLPTCLRREIVEELGVKIRVGEALGVFKHAYTHFRVTLHAFQCELLDGIPRPLGVDDVIWVKYSELGNYPMGKLDRQISERLMEANL